MAAGHAGESTLDDTFDRGQPKPLLPYGLPAARGAVPQRASASDTEPEAKRPYRRRGEDDDDEGESDAEEEAAAAAAADVTQAEEDALLAEPEEGELPPAAGVPQR